MNVDLYKLLSPNQTVAVALSGGQDSMALLHYMNANAKKFHINIVALNVEHGIRGQESLDDTAFVKDFCRKKSIPLLTYSVDAPTHSKEHKLSLEQSARILRYDCFFDAISNGKCDKIATAHHQDDKTESVLFNLFRGTGTKGLIGIKDNFEDKIIRPFLSISKEEIESYVNENSIPFVTDKTNFSDEYTRNYLRLNVIPKIKKVFPKLNDSISRLSEITKIEDDYLDMLASESIDKLSDRVEIRLPLHRAIFMRATVKALKVLGVEKDWEFVHLTDAYSLTEKKNGTKINLPKNVCAVKEYDKVVFYKEEKASSSQSPFNLGEFIIDKTIVKIAKAEKASFDVKSGLFCDLDKIPKTAVIRCRKDGDVFTKFGGGSKNLGDYLTDKKIPLRQRDSLPLIADGNDVLAIFGVAISDKIKIDSDSKNVAQLIKV